jgi:8-oxo-dGTP diphosphatase
LLQYPCKGEGKIKSMDIKDLTEKMHEFVHAKGWYKNDSKRPQTPRNLAISLSLEANEVLEHFQWQGELNDKEELATELADVALYLLQLASISGIDLEQAVLKKLEVNASREWDTNSLKVENKNSFDV